MILLGFDLETSGLDKNKEDITELGWVKWDTEIGSPLSMHSFLVQPFASQVSDVTIGLNGITEELRRTHGVTPEMACRFFEKQLPGVDYLVGHNGRGFDIPFLRSYYGRVMKNAEQLILPPDIDTRVDLPWTKPPSSNKLDHLALECKFLNPFPHRALTDSLTMMQVLSKFSIDDVVSYSKEPNIVIRILVPHPKEDNGKGKDFAKSIGYRWQEAGGVEYKYCWVKQIKANKLDDERTRAQSYEVVIIE